MTSEQLDAFLTLAQEGRFVSAARRLGVSQAGLSRQLQALERELGTRLLVRTPRGVVLTEAGQLDLVHAQRALAPRGGAPRRCRRWPSPPGVPSRSARW